MQKDIHDINIIFMGTSHFADIILQSLLSEKHKISAVYTQAGRKKKPDQEPAKSVVAITAQNNGLPVFEPEKFDEEVIKQLKKQNPDLIIVAAYGKILPKEVLEIPQFGCLNVHGSYLPKFRGPSPIQNALLLGKNETGTTIMLMNEGVDTGDIITQEKIEIDPQENYPQLLEKMAKISSKLLIDTLPLWIERKIKHQPQDNSQATLCQLIEREDGRIIWDDMAINIYNRYRAFQLWPGIYTFWARNDQNLRLKLNNITILRNNPEMPHHLGEVFELGDKIGIATGEGVVILEELQLEGKKNMTIKEFLNGYPDFIGTILK